MHSKIYKAKLITLHSNQKEPQMPIEPTKSSSIHTYFGMLQHIFQRNKHMIRQLKLSGTKIQNPAPQMIKNIIQKPQQSGQNNKKINNTKPQIQKLSISRHQSLPNRNNIFITYRHMSTNSRYSPQVNSIENKDQKSAEENITFVPIGQASQQKLQVSRKKSIQNDSNTYRLTHININMNLRMSNKLEARATTQRKSSIVKKKLSFRGSNKTTRMKTAQPQIATNNSSIRQTQKSNYETHSNIKLITSPSILHSVTPW